MKTLLTVVGIVLAVLIAVVLVGPSLIDWNAQRDRIAAEVQKATGRELTIRGDMELSLLPMPAMSAKGVSLANIEGGSAAPMMELEDLRVRVALLPLIQGIVQVEQIVLVKPKILLEVLPDGRRNWDFADASGRQQVPAVPFADTSGFEVRFDDFSIEKGSLVYRDAGTGREERIEELDARIVADSLTGPFAAKGSLRAHGIPGTFETSVGRLAGEGATPFNSLLKLADGTTRLQFSGALSTHPDAVSLRGRLKGEGDSLAGLIDSLSGSRGALPDVLARTFSLQGEISVDPQALTVSELSLQLGSTQLTGSVTSLLEAPYDARIIVNAPRFDLDRLLEEETAPAAPATASGDGGDGGDSSGGGGAAGPSWPIPADARGRIELTIEAMIYRGQLIRQLRLDAALGEGALNIERAMALLPGSSDIALTGSLQEADGAPQFTGRLDAASDNLRGFLNWVGADVGRIPPDRLRRMSLSGRVAGSAKQITFSDLDIRMDLTRLSGGVVIVPRARPGLGIGLALDSINLDGYLPSDSEDSGRLGQPQPQDGEQAAGGLALLDRFDANINLRAGALTLHGLNAKDVQLDATLQRGVLEFRTARIGDLAGGKLNYQGTVKQIGEAPQVDGKLELSVAEPTRLASWLGHVPEALAGLPPFDLSGQVTGGMDALEVDVAASGGDGEIALSGTIHPAASPLDFDLRLTGRHPEIAALGLLAGGAPAAAGLGALDVSARVAGNPMTMQVSEIDGALGPAGLSGGFRLDLSGAQAEVSDLDLSVEAKHPDLGALADAAGYLEGAAGHLGPLDLRARLTGGPTRVELGELSGTLGPALLSGAADLQLDGWTPRLEDYDLTVALKHPDLAGLVAALGLGEGLDPALGGIDLKGRVEGDLYRVRLQDLSGQVGPADLRGRLSADLSHARPAFDLDLETGELPLGLLFGAVETGEAGDGAAGGRWSREPIDMALLTDYDARLDLRMAALTHGKLRLEDVRLEAELDDGLLDLQRLTGDLNGGELQIAGKVNAGEELHAGLALSAERVDLGGFLSALVGFGRLSGPLSLNASLATRGVSEADLVAALEGAGDYGGEIAVEVGADGQGGGQSDGIPQGLLDAGVPAIQEVGDAVALLLGDFAGRPARLAGTFEAEGGVFETRDTRLEGQGATALVRATIDLPSWTVESETDVHRGASETDPMLSVALNGPLDEPDVRVGGRMFQEPTIPFEPEPAPETEAPNASEPEMEAPEASEPETEAPDAPTTSEQKTEAPNAPDASEPETARQPGLPPPPVPKPSRIAPASASGAQVTNPDAPAPEGSSREAASPEVTSPAPNLSLPEPKASEITSPAPDSLGTTDESESLSPAGEPPSGTPSQTPPADLLEGLFQGLGN